MIHIITHDKSSLDEFTNLYHKIHHLIQIDYFQHFLIKEKIIIPSNTDLILVLWIKRWLFYYYSIIEDFNNYIQLNK